MVITIKEVIDSILEIVSENIMVNTPDPNASFEIEHESQVRAALFDTITEYISEVKENIKDKITDLLEDIC